MFDEKNQKNNKEIPICRNNYKKSRECQLRFWLTSAQVWTPTDSSVKGASTPGIKLVLIGIINNL